MIFAARIFSSRIHASSLSLLRNVRLHLLRRRSPPSPAGACSRIRHYSLSFRPFQPLFYTGSAVDHRRELHTQTRVAAKAKCHRRVTHPCWTEWLSLLEYINGVGYSDAMADLSAAEDVVPDFPAELLVPASVCLTFARDRQTILGMLPMSDIEVLVQNMRPFCFKDADESERRMRSYITSRSSNELDIDKATMVDLMKYILSYISNPIAPDGKSVGSSVKNLLSGLAKLNHDEHEETHSSVKKVEMKEGDWICPRCNFMNFAKNVICLECEEERPKRNGEWVCPQCVFFNYGGNTVCFRCACKRPGDVVSNITWENPSQYSYNLLYSSNCTGHSHQANSSFAWTRNIGNPSQNTYCPQTNQPSIWNNGYSRYEAATKETDMVGMPLQNTSGKSLDVLDMSEEAKAERWFKRVAEIKYISEYSKIPDEDFPSIMPMMKGVNRYVVSKRKTPVERRLTSQQYQRNLQRVSSEISEEQ